MRIDITSLCFGFKIEKENDSGTPAWATSIGQAPKDICYVDTKINGLFEFIIGMMYKSHSDFNNLKDSNVPGLEKKEEPRGERERMMFSVFEDVYVNNMKIDGIYTLTYEREDTPSHKNRLHICYAKYLTYKDHSNKETLKEMAKKLGCSDGACWFVTDITIRNQKDLHFTAIVVNPEHSMTYKSSKERKRAWDTLIPDLNEPINKITIDSSLQKIYFGAPGTGKSFEIDTRIKLNNLSAVRTTFHPDSDYSTFVGAYKPVVDETKTKVVPVVVNNGISLNQNEGTYTEKRITYRFVMQAFMKAYLAAWKKMSDNPNHPEAQILVVEEINRGNCAQIFGDLFQLLDRNNSGFSSYPIEADTDLRNAINEAFMESEDYKLNRSINVEGYVKDYISNYGTTLSDDIQEGRILLLPPNLYIWATMNTSDQSLFPIDSAFKRRWDWVYMPIADAKKNYVIEIDNDQYDWWSFLEAINDIIESTTHSEDKKLGYFFAKAKDGRITAETFVSKVIFYLWNDVFKDNETNHKAFKDNDGELLPFRKFFHHDGTVDTNMVIKFLKDLEVYPFESSDDGTAAVSDTTPNTKRQRDKSRYRVNGTDNLNKAQMTREAFRLYIEAHPDADAQTIAQAWNGLGLKDYVRHLVETEAEYNARTKDSTDSNKRATEFELSNGEKIYLSTQFGIGNIGKFMDAVNNAGWNIRIENQA